MLSAQWLIREAINNSIIVYSHPREAYILLKGIPSQISFKKFKDPSGGDKQLFTLEPHGHDIVPEESVNNFLYISDLTNRICYYTMELKMMIDWLKRVLLDS